MQVFFLQDLALKMKLFLQDHTKNLAMILQEKLQDNFLARLWSNLARKLPYNFFLQDFCKIYISCKKSFIFSARFARYVAIQVLMQDLARLARKILARLAIFCKTVITWILPHGTVEAPAYMLDFYLLCFWAMLTHRAQYYALNYCNYAIVHVQIY